MPTVPGLLVVSVHSRAFLVRYNMRVQTRSKDPLKVKTDCEVYADAAAILGEYTSDAALSEFFRDVDSCSGQAFVCAGAVRDSLQSALADRRIRPRDLDIGVDGLSSEQFSRLGASLHAAPNKYGGFSVRFVSGIKADVWRLQDTVGTKFHCCETTLTNVLRSFVLDVNAVAYDPTTRGFCDMGALAALRSRTIGLLPSALVHSEPQFAARATVLSRRFSFRLSPEIHRLVADNLDEEALRHQLKKHGSADASVTDMATQLAKCFKPLPQIDQSS